MPAIITTHIANKRTRCVKSHASVIIHADGPVIAPYMSMPMGTIQAQQSAMMTTSAPPTSQRSRVSSVSMEVRSDTTRCASPPLFLHAQARHHVDDAVGVEGECDSAANQV